MISQLLRRKKELHFERSYPASGEPLQPKLVDAATGVEMDPRRTTIVYKGGTNAGRPEPA